MFISQSSYICTQYILRKLLITSHLLGHILVVSSSLSVTDDPEELTEEPVDPWELMLALCCLFSTSTTSATGLKVIPAGAGGGAGRDGVAGARPFRAETWEVDVTVMGRSFCRDSNFFSSSVDTSLMRPERA